MSTETMTTTEVASKQVTVYSTVGNNRKVINTSASNWSQLQADLLREDVNTNNMKAVEGRSQVTFESPDALIPDGDFVLFLYPVEVKSGFLEDDDDDFNSDDDNDQLSNDYDQEDAFNDASEMKEAATRIMKFLSDPNKKVNVAPMDPETQVLDAQARAIKEKLFGAGRK